MRSAADGAKIVAGCLADASSAAKRRRLSLRLGTFYSAPILSWWSRRIIQAPGLDRWPTKSAWAEPSTVHIAGQTIIRQRRSAGGWIMQRPAGPSANASGNSTLESHPSTNSIPSWRSLVTWSGCLTVTAVQPRPGSVNARDARGRRDCRTALTAAAVRGPPIFAKPRRLPL